MRCALCRSTQFSKRDGQLTCRNGHVQSGFVEQVAEESFGSSSLRSIRSRSKKPKQESTTQDTPSYCPRSIRLEMAQNALKMMVNALLQKGFPNEFQVIL